MRTLLQCGIALVLLLGWGERAGAQAFENARVVTLRVGMLIPSGDMSKVFGPGVLGRANLRLPVSQGTSVGIESGIYAPNAKSGNATLYQIPVRVLMYFPVASEGSSSPYFAVGPGVTFNSISGNGKSGSSKNPDPYFTYALKLGWAFRPEHMASTLFEIGGRFEQQFVPESPDFQTFDVDVSVGRTF